MATETSGSRWNDIPKIEPISVNVDLDQIERLLTFAKTGEIVPVLEEQEMCVNCGEREATHDVIDRDDTVEYVERLALCDVCDPDLED